MAFSIKKIGLDGAALVQGLVSKTTWISDLKRGLSILQSGGLAVVDRSFSEVELHKLRGRLDLCHHKLDQCFQTLGKKNMAHWKNHQEMDDKEKKSLFSQIETLKTEKEQMIASIAALLTPIESTPVLSDRQTAGGEPETPEAESPKPDIPEADAPKEST